MAKGRTLVTYILAAVVRLFAFRFRNDLAERIEINTPLNSMKRVVEGSTRLAVGVSPYSSDVFHEPPAFLQFYTFLIETIGDYMPFVFILFDILTAHCLYVFTNKYIFKLYVRQEKEKNEVCKDGREQLLSGKDFTVPAVYVSLLYLFNPYTIFNCVAMTTTAVSNFLLAVFFVGITYGCPYVSIISLVLASAQTFYPIVLISPFFVSMYQRSKSYTKAIKFTVAFLICLSGFLYYCKYLHGDWSFIEHTYGFTLQVSEQQPNVGVFWYFFMEMFEHFRLLFLYSYQMNVTILYFIPLTLKFRKDPTLLAACFVTLIAIFKSYPSIGDFTLTLALLPCWKHLYHCMQQIFISSVVIIVTTVLAPILWDLWIFWGSANANFFFGASLAFITAHIFILTDLAFAVTKRDYLLKFGTARKINGEDAKLALE